MTKMNKKHTCYIIKLLFFFICFHAAATDFESLDSKRSRNASMGENDVTCQKKRAFSLIKQNILLQMDMTDKYLGIVRTDIEIIIPCHECKCSYAMSFPV